MTETRAVPALLRALNERTVLDAVRADGPMSRAEVARRTGISRPTVSLVLRSLLDDGLVRETEHDPGGPHYGAVYYEADPEAAVVLGVDLGSRVVRTALCDLAGGVRAREEIRSRGSVEQRIDALASSVRSLLRTSKLPGDLLENAVVALPAVVSPADGRVSSADVDPCSAAVSQFAADHAARKETKLEPPFDVQELFAAAGAGDAVGVAVVEEV